MYICMYYGMHSAPWTKIWAVHSGDEELALDVLSAIFLQRTTFPVTNFYLKKHLSNYHSTGIMFETCACTILSSFLTLIKFSHCHWLTIPNHGLCYAVTAVHSTIRFSLPVWVSSFFSCNNTIILTSPSTMW